MENTADRFKKQQDEEARLARERQEMIAREQAAKKAGGEEGEEELDLGEVAGEDEAGGLEEREAA